MRRKAAAPLQDGNLVSFGLGETCAGHSGQLWLGGRGARMLSHLSHL